jgi:hypothetical protein
MRIGTRTNGVYEGGGYARFGVQVLSVVVMGGRVINCRHFVGPYSIRLQGP